MTIFAFWNAGVPVGLMTNVGSAVMSPLEVLNRTRPAAPQPPPPYFVWPAAVQLGGAVPFSPIASLPA